MDPPDLPEAQPIAWPTGTRQAPAPVIRQAAAALREVLRALAPDPSAAPTDPVSFGADTEPLMRAVLARYGFERLPATRAELFGLFEYCDCLDAASGIGMRPPDQLAAWQAASFEVWRRKRPDLMPAIERFCAGDVDGLRALHRAEDTLARLGRDYFRPAERELPLRKDRA
jgi:hypothetical protein